MPIPLYKVTPPQDASEGALITIQIVDSDGIALQPFTAALISLEGSTDARIKSTGERLIAEYKNKITPVPQKQAERDLRLTAVKSTFTAPAPLDADKDALAAEIQAKGAGK